MNMTEAEEVHMYNANRKLREEQYKLRIGHAPLLMFIFVSGLMTGTMIVAIIMGFIK